jgi:hypothetical protein
MNFERPPQPKREPEQVPEQSLEQALESNPEVASTEPLTQVIEKVVGKLEKRRDAADTTPHDSVEDAEGPVDPFVEVITPDVTPDGLRGALDSLDLRQ